jgi:RNA recognition motif-containing protein
VNCGVECQRVVHFRLVCHLARAAPAHPLSGQRPPPQKSARPDGGPSSPDYSQLLRVSEVTKLYVGNLPFSATEEAVRTLFSAHGTVETISLITDRETGQARGFGFVEMSSADASRAMQALNGTDFEGRALKINEAQDRARSGGGGGGGGNRGGPRRY